MLERGVERHNREHPRHAEHDRAEYREHHRLEAHASAADGAGRVFDNREDRVERCNEMKDRRGVGRNCGIVDKQTRKRAREYQQHGRQATNEHKRQHERSVVSLSHAIVIARTKVLRRERGDRHAERLGHHPDNAVQAAGKAPSGRDIGTKRVDRHLNQNVGDRIRRRLNAQRKTTRKHALANAAIDTELG